MFDGCFSWNSCYTYVGGKKSSSNPSQVECLFDEAGPSQQIKGFGIFAGWKNGLWQFTTWTHKSDDPACQWLRWHSESLGSPSLDLSVHFPLQYGGYVMVSAMGMNLLLIYLGCKEVETREIEGLVAKLLLALQNLSILTRFLCNIDLVPDSSLLTT